MYRSKQFFGRLRRLWQTGWQLFQDRRLESLETSTLTWLDRAVHFCIFVIREFVRNRCLSRATALAYTTLLALVPLLAVVVSIVASLFHQYYTEEKISQYIDRFLAYVAPQLDLVPLEYIASGATNLAEPRQLQGIEKENTVSPKVVSPDQFQLERGTQSGQQAAPSEKRKRTGRDAVAQAISDAIRNVRTGALSVSGIIGLILVAIMLLATVEAAFNDIWGVTEGRTWSTRLVLYWTAISFGPVVILALALLLSSRLKGTEELLAHVPYLQRLLVRLLPYMMATVAFTVLYKLIPNTTVQWQAAFLGGLVGGSLWLVSNLLQGQFVTRVLNASMIYGSLASLPIFLGGLYVSWVVLLIGAQTAYIWQNREVFWQEPLIKRVNQTTLEVVAVAVVGCICRRFAVGEPPPDMVELAKEIGVPTQLIARAIRPLVNHGLIGEINSEKGGYLPARMIDRLTIWDVLNCMRRAGGVEVEPAGREVPLQVIAALKEVWLQEKELAARIDFLTLLRSKQYEAASRVGIDS